MAKISGVSQYERVAAAAAVTAAPATTAATATAPSAQVGTEPVEKSASSASGTMDSALRTSKETPAGVPGTAQSAQEKQAAENKQIRKAVEDLNRQMKNSVAIFGIHEDTNRVTIKIVDKNTDKVIKEFPPEQTLDMIAKMWEVAGILVDEKR